MTRIGRIVTAVTGSPAPVLFLDSCVLLDVARAPLRNKPGEVRVAGRLLAAVRKTPKAVHLPIASPTPTEWNDHIDEAEADCATAVRAYDAVASACGHLGLGGVAALPTPAADLPGRLRQLSADLLGAAGLIDHNAAALGRAADRIIAATPPAKPGGKGAKDSIILEHVVETTASLRQAGFAAACVFGSSNTKDFAVSAGTTLSPSLAPAFHPVQLQYAASLEHAEAILLAAGWVP